MSEIQFDALDPDHAFDFTGEQQGRIGHVMSFQIGPEASGKLGADLRLNRPTDDAEVQVVGVLTRIAWPGGRTAPISLGFQVSAPNAQNLQVRLRQGLVDTSCSFEFVVFDYDPDAKKYFIAFQGSATEGIALNGLLVEQGSRVQLRVSDEPGAVESPQNFAVTTSIAPRSDDEQAVTYAAADQKNVAIRWGVKVVVPE